MRKLNPLAKGSFVAGAAMIAAIGLAASPAFADPTWTVSGSTGTDGAFSAVSTNTVLTDLNTKVQLKCTTSNATGTAQDGTGLPGAGIASIDSVTWDGCTGPLSITFTVQAQGTPWALNAVTYDGSDVTTGTLTGVKAHISGIGCTADFGGATSGSTATLDATYTNSSHTLTLLGTGDLHAYNVSGTCLGLINNNDPASYTGDYIVTPDTLHITSP